MQTTQSARQQEPGKARTRKAKARFTRQRLGCLTCRHRKKKCDTVYPVCGHCTRLNLVCKRETPRELPAGANGSSSVVSTHATSNATAACHECGGAKGLADPTSSAPIYLANVFSQAKTWQKLDPSLILGHNGGSTSELVASRRSMIRYYVQIFAFVLTTNVENNCFLTVLLPMAFESPALMKALAAWSSSHLSLRDEAFTDVALQHRGSALRNFKVAMEDEDLSTEMALAVTLIFCSLEVITDGTGSWYHHLCGGAALLTSNQPVSSTRPSSPSAHTMKKLQSTEGKWLLKNFAYHDILMSITMNSRPLLRGDYWVSAAEESAADPYFGLAERVLYLICETSHLNAEMAEAKQLIADRDVSDPLGPATAVNSFSSRARAIEDELREWKCRDSGSSSPLVFLAETYRSAARIHLYRTIRAHVPEAAEHIHAKIDSQVKSIVEATGKIPEGSLPECTLLFPLFMAGGEAQDSDDILAIRSKLQSMNRWRRFRNVEAALEVLDELWRLNLSRAQGERSNRVDWLDIVEHRGWKLSIS